MLGLIDFEIWAVMGSTPVTVLMDRAFEQDIYELDRELASIQQDCMAPFRMSQNQSRPGHSLKRHTNSNPKSVNCEDCVESQTADNTAHSVMPVNTI